MYLQLHFALMLMSVSIATTVMPTPVVPIRSGRFHVYVMMAFLEMGFLVTTSTNAYRRPVLTRLTALILQDRSLALVTLDSQAMDFLVKT